MKIPVHQKKPSNRSVIFAVREMATPHPWTLFPKIPLKYPCLDVIQFNTWQKCDRTIIALGRDCFGQWRPLRLNEKWGFGMFWWREELSWRSAAGERINTGGGVIMEGMELVFMKCVGWEKNHESPLFKSLLKILID